MRGTFYNAWEKSFMIKNDFVSLTVYYENTPKTVR